jgi:hypothetical protein
MLMRGALRYREERLNVRIGRDRDVCPRPITHVHFPGAFGSVAPIAWAYVGNTAARARLRRPRLSYERSLSSISQAWSSTWKAVWRSSSAIVQLRPRAIRPSAL